jgi:hypothetical protein
MRLKGSFMRMFRFRPLLPLFSVVLYAAAACSDDAEQIKQEQERSESSGELPRYVIATAVSTDESSTTYVKTVPRLDGKKLSLADAREFGGWSDMKVLGRWVFVSGGEESTVQRSSRRTK